ncbi:hypothetical protein KBC31_02385 [Candidatus Saccharibacteria bacterium]|nr:hypothetical protein [Candidatus Saccharibacteria bacterium]
MKKTKYSFKDNKSKKNKTEFKKTARSKYFKYISLIILIVVIAAGARFVYWGSNPAKASTSALKSAENQSVIIDRNDDYVSVMPKDIKPTKAFILYPGGNVEPEAYIPSFASLSQQAQIMVIIPRVPFALAFLDIDSAYSVRSLVIHDNPQINSWFLGGHSLGGVAACRAITHEDQYSFSGFVLLASYCSNDISDNPTNVISIVGSDDGLISQEDIKTHKNNLNTKARFEVIEGMNHAEFGAYGPQKGDNNAKISNQQATAAFTKLLASFIDDNTITGE